MLSVQQHCPVSCVAGNYAATGIAQCERDKELMQKDKQLKVCVSGSCMKSDCQ